MTTPSEKIKRFMHFSPVFYGKEGTISDVILKTQGSLGSLQEHYKTLKSGSTEAFVKFCKASLTEQRKTLELDGQTIIQWFYEVIDKVNHDKSLMMYILPTLDGLLFDDRKNVKFIKRLLDEQPKDKNLLTVFQNLLLVPDFDPIVYESTFRVLAVIYSELDRKAYHKQQVDFLKFLLLNEMEEGKKKKFKLSTYVLLNSLTFLLRIENLVHVFVESGGIETIFTILSKNSSELQVMYYAFLCIWLISYVPDAIKSFIDPALRFIATMTEVILKLSREKIVRVAFATFRNLCDTSPEAIELMVDAGLLKIIDTLMKGNIKDKDIIEDLEYVGTILEKNLKILSSFEKYVKEINTQVLDWSPVHSEKFWKENVKKFEDQDFLLIRKLVDLLQSDRPKTVAIACFDLGEFCRYHPFGRNVIEKMKGKDYIMNKARGDNQLVKEQALVALQKIMIHNWQAIGTN